ncbi:uncharacterized protein LOC129761118 [Toxorhynchites rutilus septentrionalis]|uniref:uncharacterized protein LOC129761118 n=1 Tax=Toxorhynchites rutilus septentrionalis TaxID=329112 RepID=UPI00247AC297|nr:uncharacterized protein LOC129761118 [Toxorhynchites rutilus septentrionalis]
MNFQTNLTEIESEIEEVGIFARRGQVMRSPPLNQPPAPKPTSDKSIGEQPNLQYEKTKLGEAKRASDELYEYIKPSSNVHAVIRTLTTKIKSALAAAEREQQFWRARAEKAENALKENVQSKPIEAISTPMSDSTPLTAKRKRLTPEEKRAAKKQKDGSDVANGENSQNNEEINEWKMIERKKREEKKKDKLKPRLERPKPDALIVATAGAATYAEILRKVKEDPSLKNLGENVAKKDPTIKSSTYKELVEKSLGETAKVKALFQETVVECRNLDEITTDTELRVALKTAKNRSQQAVGGWATLQKCLDGGYFPDMWKKQRLVLLPKPGKPPGDPSSYRPICLLDTLGKLLEKIILNRLSRCTESEHGLSRIQFGFRKNKSTVDAILSVVEAAEKVLKQKKTWKSILCSNYGQRKKCVQQCQLGSYRRSVAQTDGTKLYKGQESFNITAGVPQGSILGPTLWNGMYDEVLRLKLPQGVVITGFADDISLTVTVKSREEVEMLATEAIQTVED